MKHTRKQISRARKPDKQLIVSIPKQVCTLQWSPVLRFNWKNTSGSDIINQVFTTINLLNTVVVGKTSTTFVNLFAFVKLRYLRLRASGLMVAAVPNMGNFLTLSMQDTASAYSGNGIVYEVSPSGVEVGEIVVRPKPTQKWGQWNSVADNCSFTLTGQVTELNIELGLSFRNMAGSAYTSVTTGTAASIGAVYFRGLDSLTASATLYPADVEVGSAI